MRTTPQSSLQLSESMFRPTSLCNTRSLLLTGFTQILFTVTPAFGSQHPSNSGILCWHLDLASYKNSPPRPSRTSRQCSTIQARDYYCYCYCYFYCYCYYLFCAKSWSIVVASSFWLHDVAIWGFWLWYRGSGCSRVSRDYSCLGFPLPETSTANMHWLLVLAATRKRMPVYTCPSCSTLT